MTLFLPDQATIHAHTRTSDGAGGSTDTWSPGAPVPGRISPASATAGTGERGAVAGRIDDRTTHIITLPAGTPVTKADRIEIGGRLYDVTLVRTRSVEITRRVEVRET